MKKLLQPLPRRLSAEGAPAATAAAESTAPKPGKPCKSPSQRKKELIEPRRIALKYASQTIVLEYKEEDTGKLRHRSFRIDVNRFETAAQCERKLWGRLSKAIVPGALQAAQVGKLVAQLFEHEKQQNPDADELEMATERFMAAQVEEPTPTRSGLKPMPLAASQVKYNQLPEAKTEKKGGSGAGSSGDDAEGDKENSPNLELAASPGRSAARPSASAASASAAAASPSAGATSKEKASENADSSAASGDAPTARPDSEEAAKTAGLGPSKGLQPLPKAGGLTSSGSSLFADMPKLPGTLGGGAVAGRRAGLAPLSGGGGAMAGGFGSLTAASLGLNDEGDDDDEDEEPVFSSQATKKSAADTASAKAVHAEVNASVDSPASAPSSTMSSPPSSKGSGVDRFLSIGAKSPANSAWDTNAKKQEEEKEEEEEEKEEKEKEAAKKANTGANTNAKKAASKEDSFEFDHEEVVEEDIPDYADDFEDDFEDEGDDNVSLPLPGSNAKEKGAAKHQGFGKGDAGDSDEECRAGETEAEKEERLRLRGDDVDLQQVDETKLEKYKRLMEEEFEKNAIKPGDPNWKHDVQVEFGSAEEDCGWDEEDEEAEDEEDAF